MPNALTATLGEAGLSQDERDIVDKSLAFVRKHLDMEVAYLSEFVGDDLVFRATDAPGFEDMVHVGGTMPLDQVYCRHILAGRLPELIPDTFEHPFALDIPITKSVPVRSHVSIPILREDGTPYGMFCCLSRSPKPSLNERDLEVMRAFAELSSEHVRTSLESRSRRDMVCARVNSALTGDTLQSVFQPIYCFGTNKAVGLEALTRFSDEPLSPPNLLFDAAAEVGTMVDLELAAIERALARVTAVPEDIYISVNASPETVQSGRLPTACTAIDIARVVLEVTEHRTLTDAGAFLNELARLRKQGMRLAIDDVGAGYSGLQRLVALQPDIIKLDMSLTRGVHLDVARRSLAAALVNFAGETGARLVAEGIEEKAEQSALETIGVEYGQGYLYSRPAPIETVLSTGLSRIAS